MPGINPTMRAIAAFRDSNSQPQDADNAGMEVNPPRLGDSKPACDDEVIDLTGLDDEEASDQTKVENKPKFVSEDPAPEPRTAVKPAAPPARPSPTDLEKTNGRGSDQRPAAQKGQPVSSPVPTPTILPLSMAVPTGAAPGLAVPQLRLASNRNSSASPTSGNASGTVPARLSLPERVQLPQQGIEELNTKLKNEVQKSANLKKDLAAAKKSAGESKKEVEELKVTLSEAAEHIEELKEKLEQAESNRNDPLQKVAQGDASAAATKEKEAVLEKQFHDLTDKLHTSKDQALERNLNYEEQLDDLKSKLQVEISAKQAVEDRAEKAEHDLKNANAATEEARKREQEANEKLRFAKSKLDLEIRSREEAEENLAEEKKLRTEAEQRAVKAQLAATEAEANAGTAIAEKNEALKQVQAQKQLAETAIAEKDAELKKVQAAATQAAERKEGLETQLAAAVAALAGAEKSKKTAAECYKKVLEEKNNAIKALEARCQNLTINRANDRDTQKAAEDRVKQLKADLKAKEKENAGLLNKIQQQVEDFAGQEATMDHQDEVVLKLEKEIEALKKEIEEQKKKIEEVKRKGDKDYERVKSRERDLQETVKALEERINNQDRHRRSRSRDRKRRRDDDREDNRDTKRNNTGFDLREELRRHSQLRPRQQQQQHRNNDRVASRRDGRSTRPPASVSPPRNFQDIESSQQVFAPQPIFPPADPRRQPQRREEVEEKREDEHEEGECCH